MSRGYGLIFSLKVVFTFLSLPHPPGLQGSLDRLQLEYVDIVFANRSDPNSPMEGKNQHPQTWQPFKTEHLSNLHQEASLLPVKHPPISLAEAQIQG